MNLIVSRFQIRRISW